VFAAGAYGDLGIEARLLVVLGEIHLEAVVELINRSVKRIIRIARVDALVAWARGLGLRGLRLSGVAAGSEQGGSAEEE
jgi:hypothetical protein